MRGSKAYFPRNVRGYEGGFLDGIIELNAAHTRMARADAPARLALETSLPKFNSKQAYLFWQKIFASPARAGDDR